MCRRYAEGLASKLQEMYLSLTVAALANFTPLSLLDCLTASQVDSDLSDRLWLHRSLDCDPCSLQKRLVHDIVSNWPEPTFHHDNGTRAAAAQ